VTDVIEYLQDEVIYLNDNEIQVTATVRLGRRGQMVLPAEVRRALAVKEGDELLIAVWPGGKVTMIRKPRSFAEALAGLYGHLWKGIDPLIYQKTERETWES
jgi:AbrB family looped-hinge helix DNA binding protein